MLDRKPQILDVASELLQSRSFTSFSYQDLSDRLGISKASVHHHFATKEELLHALTQRYRAKQRKRLAELDSQYESPADRLDAYLAMMAQVAHSGNKICPLGALQAEFNVIPQKVQEDIRELFDFGKSWLAGVLAEGSELGEFVFDGAASERAVLIMSAVQGALQIARATGPKEFNYLNNLRRDSAEFLVRKNLLVGRHMGFESAKKWDGPRRPILQSIDSKCFVPLAPPEACETLIRRRTLSRQRRAPDGRANLPQGRT